MATRKATLPAWIWSELRWKLLLARLVVSVLAVMATVAVVPGLSIDGDYWRWVLVLGAVFGVLNGVLKPVLQVLTFRYLFLSLTRHEGGSPEEVLLKDLPLILTVVGWVATSMAVLAAYG